MGDTGIPKNAARVPSGGYLTEIVTFPPDPRNGWTLWRPQKQPACRHNQKGNVTFVDGHVETHRWLVADTIQPARQGVVRGNKIPANPPTDFDWLKDRTSVKKPL